MVVYVVHIGVTHKMVVNSWMALAKRERRLKLLEQSKEGWRGGERRVGSREWGVGSRE